MIRFATLPLSLLLVAAGCRTIEPLSTESEAGPGPMTDVAYAELDEPFRLERGASTVVDGQIVRFDHVTEDSRCPADVDCVWEGRATISLSLIAGDTPDGVQLSIPGFVSADSEPRDLQSAVVNGYTFTLLQLDPYPGQDGVDAAMVPTATLRVTSSE